jgi:type IV secretory pathway VirJ component
MRISIKIALRLVTIFLIWFFGSISGVKAQVSSSVNDLPIQLSGSRGSNVVLVIYLSGDGGWNDFNQQLAQGFEKLGYGVVTLNTRKYFWDQKSPEVFAGDIDQLSKYYMKEWKKSSVVIVGYSFGADVGIFLSDRVSNELQKKITKIALISPSASSDFVIRLSDMVGESENVNRKFKVKPEIEKSDLPVICIFGKDEQLMLKTNLQKNKNLTICELPGDHRYNDNFAALIKMMGM